MKNVGTVSDKEYRIIEEKEEKQCLYFITLFWVNIVYFSFSVDSADGVI